MRREPKTSTGLTQEEASKQLADAYRKEMIDRAGPLVTNAVIETSGVLTVPEEFSAWAKTLPTTVRQRLSIHDLRLLWEPIIKNRRLVEETIDALKKVDRWDCTPDVYGTIEAAIEDLSEAINGQE